MDFIIWYTGILILILLWLLINRHIIWWVWYNFFPPIIVWLAINILPIEWGGMIIAASILGRIVTKFITEYIYLSLYPKYSLYTIISLLIFMVSGSIFINQYHNTIFSQHEAYNIMLFFVIIMTTSIKVYTWWKWARSLIWRWHIIRFFLLSYSISIIFSSDWILHYMMIHPLISIILALITMILGLYNGLQIKEIIRFRKLIWEKITQKKIRN